MLGARRIRTGPNSNVSVAPGPDAFWARRFGRDPAVLGRGVTVDGHSVTIVGVTAPEFTGLIPGRSPDITLPLSVRAIREPGYLTMHGRWTNLNLVARLKPNVAQAAAWAAADAVFQQYMSEPENQRIRRQDPDGYSNAQLVPAARGSSGLRRQYEVALRVLMGMVALVLLVASLNVANLLLARSTARAKEVAIRLCVGGGRGRLIRQFLTEGVLLALCGGTLGLLVARSGTAFIMNLFSVGEAPLLLDVTPNPRSLLFTAGVSLVTGIGFALLPALRSSRIDLTPVLKEGGVPASVSRNCPRDTDSSCCRWP